MDIISIEFVRQLISHLDAKKAERITFHEFPPHLYFANWSIVCSARSAMHAKFLHKEIMKFFKERNIQPYGSSKRPEYTSWIIADFDSLVVNIFTGNFREKYDLESIYAERFPEIPQESLCLV